MIHNRDQVENFNHSNKMHGKSSFPALKLFLKPFRPSLCVLKNDQEVFYSLEKDLGDLKIFQNSSISPSSS